MHVICLSILVNWFLPGDKLSCRLNEGIGEWGQHWQTNRNMDCRVGQGGDACFPFERSLCFGSAFIL